MSNNHFKYLHLRNFKRFEDLEVGNIGQFNLVLGDNSTGKTSLLEALVCAGKKAGALHQSLYKLYYLKTGRIGLAKEVYEHFINIEKFNFLKLEDYIPFEIDYQAGNKKLTSDYIYYPLSKVLEHNRSRSVRNIENNVIDVKDLDEKDVKVFNVPYVGLRFSDVEDFLRLYEEYIVINSELENQLTKTLSDVFSDIQDIRSTGAHGLLLKYKNQKLRRQITQEGDGLSKTLGIFTSIVSYSGKSLMIDEIDAGIYHNRMKEYWKAILVSAMENDVQLLCSTHNRECIESFEEALKELGEDYTEKARTITLKKDDNTGDVTAYTNKFSVLEHAIELGNDLR